MEIVARLHTGYSKRRSSGNRFDLEAPGTLDDSRGVVRVVAQASSVSTTARNKFVQDSYYIGCRILATNALFRTFCCCKTGWGGFGRISTGRHSHYEM